MPEFESNSVVEWVRAIGSWGTFIAAIAVIFGFRYTKRSVENQTAQLKSEHEWRVNEQFYKACTELGSNSEHARIAALFTLQSLVEKDHIPLKQAVYVITALIRSRSTDIAQDVPSSREDIDKYRAPEDIATAVFALRDLSRSNPDEWSEISGNLDGANLSGLTIEGVAFRGWSFRDATFVNTYLAKCSFSNAFMERSAWFKCGIVNGDFRFTQIQGGTLVGVELFNSDFRNMIARDSVWSDVTIAYQGNTVERPFDNIGGAPDNLEKAAAIIHEHLAEHGRASVTLS